jgi:hypothetical protein
VKVYLKQVVVGGCQYSLKRFDEPLKEKENRTPEISAILSVTFIRVCTHITVFSTQCITK